MALSNIGREPRREITEQAIGLLALGGLLFADYKFSIWFQWATGGEASGCPWPLGLLFGVLALILGLILTIGGWYFAHTLGEIVCDWMRAARIDPRPRQRY